MKKYLTTTAFGLVTLLTVTTSFAAGKSAEKKSLASASEKFTTIDKGTIVTDGNTTTAYNRKGHWVYTIEHISADNLPLDIFKTIRGTYGNYYIAGMEKIDVPASGPVYFVHMQDKTSYKTVRVSNDETEIIEDFTKQ